MNTKFLGVLAFLLLLVIGYYGFSERSDLPHLPRGLYSSVRPHTQPQPFPLRPARQLPPPPPAAAPLSVQPAEPDIPGLRLWRSAAGAHTTAACLVGASGGAVRLQKKDGALVDVPKSQLAADDWAWAHDNFHKTPGFGALALPSGAVLKESGIEPQPGWPERLMTANSFVACHDSGQLAVVANRVGEALEGPAAGLYDDGHLQTLADYHANQLAGALRLWGENNEKLQERQAGWLIDLQNAGF